MKLVPASRIFHHVTSCQTTSLQVLRDHFKLTTEKAQELLSLGSIYHNKNRLFTDEKLPRGAYLRLHLYPKRYPTQGIDWKKRVVFETKDFLVINKVPGIPTHAALDNALENCLEQTRRALDTDLFVTQRLDNPVGGLLVFAKNKKAQAQFNRWLVEKKVKKVYEAIVEGPCPTGFHQHFMEPSPRAPKVLSKEAKSSWLSCELTIQSCEEVKRDDGGTFRLRLELHTGRTHQIRAQLAFLGTPIIGDKLYGSKRISQLGSASIELKAIELSWPGQGGITVSKEEG